MNKEQLSICNKMLEVVEKAKFDCRANELIIWGNVISRFAQMIKKEESIETQETKTKLETAKVENGKSK